MESELRCPVCKNIFKNPVLLPCNDSFCLSCAASLLKEVSPSALPPLAMLLQQQQQHLKQAHFFSHPQQQQHQHQQHQRHFPSVSSSSSLEQQNNINNNNNILETGSVASGSSNESAFDSYQEMSDLDKLSLISEADSGVVVSNSRPNSYVGSSSSSAGSCPSTPGGPSLQQQQQQQLHQHPHQHHPLFNLQSSSSSSSTHTLSNGYSSSVGSKSNITNTTLANIATLSTNTLANITNTLAAKNANSVNVSNYLVSHPLSGSISCSIDCPSCHKTTLLDENGVHSLPKNHALTHVVERIFDGGAGFIGNKKNNAGYPVGVISSADISSSSSSSSSSKSSSTPPPPHSTPAIAPPAACQLCPEHSDAATATVFCEHCQIFYCGSCRERCHPARGPFATHPLVPASSKMPTTTTMPTTPILTPDSSTPKTNMSTIERKSSSRRSANMSRCADHPEEQLSMFCLLCKSTCCFSCLQAHSSHDVQPLQPLCKSGKTELSHVLQSLSEKARVGTDHLQRLKCDVEKVEESCVEFEASIVAQCDALISAVQRRKAELIKHVEMQKREKSQMLKDQVGENSTQLQQITGLLQYSIEVLKEPDPSAFLLVSSGLIQRVVAKDMQFQRHLEASPKITAEFEYKVEKRAAAEAIENIRLVHVRVPGAPQIIPEDCSSENNSVTIAWAPAPAANPPAFYVLELDDGTGNGNFRKVYGGPESVCSIDGLHFNSIYSARVKACNQAGEGPYSQLVRLQTADVAWFNFDRTTAHNDITFSNSLSTISCSSFDARVVLGNVGFSRGVHYWEIRVDKFDNPNSNMDPAVGVARADVAKDIMLGNDDKGWSMYIDPGRSWFKHAGKHSERTDGGIRAGSVIGVLLDLDEKCLSFFVNDVMQGPPRVFSQLEGVFYPAVSLNRDVTFTLTSGLDPPTIVEEQLPL